MSDEEARQILLLLDQNRRLRGSLEQKSNGSGSPNENGEEHGSRQDKQGQKKEENEQGEDKNGQKDEQANQEPKPTLRQRVTIWTRTHPMATLAVIAGAVVLAIAGVVLWNYLQSFESTDDAQIDGHIHQIGSRVSGTVVSVYTEENRSVVAGQALVELDPRDYRAALAQAEANLAQAQAALEAQAPNVPITQTTQATAVETSQLEIGNATDALEAARRNHESALAELQQNEVNAQNAAAEEARYRGLVEKHEVSRETSAGDAECQRNLQPAAKSRGKPWHRRRKHYDAAPSANPSQRDISLADRKQPVFAERTHETHSLHAPAHRSGEVVISRHVNRPEPVERPGAFVGIRRCFRGTWRY